jgi:hypothetical protein
MGQGFSSNYDQIDLSFTPHCWKIHSAMDKTTNERVSLWFLDPELLVQNYPNKSDQYYFIQCCLMSIKEANKLRYPHILKIIDADLPPSAAFASEPVCSSVRTLIGTLNTVDFTYPSFQIAEMLQFLHNTAHKAHLNLHLDGVFLNETLTVKIFRFEFAADITGGDAV